MSEEWRRIVDYPDYGVSSEGRVRRVDDGQLLLDSVKPDGYVYFSIPTRSRPVHRLVAEAFLPNPEGLPCVLHWDDDKRNNTVENLRWGTHSDNRLDSVRNGTHYFASRTHCPQGHPYSGDNLYVRPDGRRECRECRRVDNRLRARARRRHRRAA